MSTAVAPLRQVRLPDACAAATGFGDWAATEGGVGGWAFSSAPDSRHDERIAAVLFGHARRCHCFRQSDPSRV
jgi:hypothetical protein